MSRWGELIPHHEDDLSCLCGCRDGPESRPVHHNPLPRPLSEHCRPGRCLALTCCSYECSQGRCPSIPEEFRTATP